MAITNIPFDDDAIEELRKLFGGVKGEMTSAIICNGIKGIVTGKDLLGTRRSILASHAPSANPLLDDAAKRQRAAATA